MPARSTIERYLDALRRLFIMYDVNGWSAPLRAKARIWVKPKRYFVDPSLAADALVRLEKKVLANPQARIGRPAFLAVLVGRGSVAYRRKDGVYVIPVATLTA